jgi:hydroxymethylpyrimidine/phosphomethylpyrimidine kinase
MSRWFEFERIDTPNTHGTGCTLSSAIASFLARGEGLEKAVEHAREYMQAAIAAGSLYQLGHGHGPVHHFHALWQENGR